MSLLDEINQCRLCQATFGYEPRPVIQGEKCARILIAGQAPSLSVHKSGKPFDDASGKRLRMWLGVNEQQFYDPCLFAIVPMAFCYPGRGKSGDNPPPKVCATIWREKILEAFNEVRLTILIGQYAQAYHLDDFNNVTESAKQWSAQLPSKIAIPHPSPRNFHWLKNNPWFEINAIPALKERVNSIIKN
ncbi:uracil-DNA glycosylase family protein [Pseudoalteromonas sp. SMS1]|uniref:uracil-DNA glycosylase family protein n=1 Tax=Pseudoalteromonas sp. SMS1 TaxID=2908894 RepID=UPI001F4284BC|nr:uracil-DNA glycosylase family protein [Pseudoalteromonas sp. SMS1]MCF2857771.1 uracil-DNA glycosylase family protein [Pseudoalteromonas sp. SMS1]